MITTNQYVNKRRIEQIKAIFIQQVEIVSKVLSSSKALRKDFLREELGAQAVLPVGIVDKAVGGSGIEPRFKVFRGLVVKVVVSQNDGAGTTSARAVHENRLRHIVELLSSSANSLCVDSIRAGDDRRMNISESTSLGEGLLSLQVGLLSSAKVQDALVTLLGNLVQDGLVDLQGRKSKCQFLTDFSNSNNFCSEFHDVRHPSRRIPRRFS